MDFLTKCSEVIQTMSNRRLIKFSGWKRGENMIYLKKKTLTPWIMKPEGSMSHSQGLFDNPYTGRINPVPRIDTYFFKIHSNIVLPSAPRTS